MIGRFKIKNFWFSIQKKNTLHPSHNHPKSVLSGVYYFKIDNNSGGEINLDLESKLSEDGWLDLLFSLVVVPTFPEDRLTIITDYPASQAALARLNPDGETAARFEVFWGQTELANGYHELLDPKEQLQRFEQDQTTRAASGLPVMPLDEHFLAALKAGLPDCAGVALGLDRLLMKITTLNHIDKVISFPVSRA